MYKGEKKSGKYMRIYISGIDDLPVRLERKKSNAKRSDKDALVYGINVVPLEEDEYYGFEIDGNGRFLLGDFTVTHNTSIIKAIAAEYNLPIFIIDFEVINRNESFSSLMKDINYHTNNAAYILAFEDVDRSKIFKKHCDSAVSLACLMNEIDGLLETHGRILFMTANDYNKFHNVDSTALMRPGRIDKTIKVDYCDFDQIQRLLFHFYGIQSEKILNLKEKDLRQEKIAPANVINILQRYYKDEDKAIRTLFNHVDNDNGDIQEIEMDDEASQMLQEYTKGPAEMKVSRQMSRLGDIIRRNENNVQRNQKRKRKLEKELQNMPKRRKTIKKRLENLEKQLEKKKNVNVKHKESRKRLQTKSKEIQKKQKKKE
jgi:hypothetical protein